jgi:thymidylate synthase
MNIGNYILKKKIPHFENQYLNMVNRIIKHGTKQEGRNGNTRSLIGQNLRFNLQNNTIPLITTKKLAWKTCLKELFWFISGDTNNKTLKDQNVKIWNQNASREFLDSRGLHHLVEDDLGPVYGHQWRHYNAKYYNSNINYEGKGVDQLQNVINQLKDKETRNSRRIILNSWNPNQIDEMALPPCHVMSQYIVKDGELSVLLYQRSGDVGLGIPFNIASYSFLAHILGKHCDLKPKEFIHIIGDAHIYEEHVNALQEQMVKTPYHFPKVNIENKYEKIEDYGMKDIEIIDYKYHDKIEMIMKE